MIFFLSTKCERRTFAIVSTVIIPPRPRADARTGGHDHRNEGGVKIARRYTVKAYREEFVRAHGDRGAMRARLENELSDVEKKFDRLLKLVEEGQADAAVAGPRLNELATKKRTLAGELAMRPDEAPAIPPGDGATSYRKLVEGLRLKALNGENDEREAARLMRGLVRRIVVMPRDEDEPQGLEIEAGFSPVQVSTDHDCNVGCGGWN